MRCHRRIFLAAILCIAQPIPALSSTPTTIETTSSAISLNQSISLGSTHNNNNNNNNNDYQATEGSACIRGFSRTPIFQISTFIWTVHLPGQMMPSKQGSGEWGGGFLDALRFQCGIIFEWTAQLDGAPAPNTGILAMFYSQTCSLRNVQDAAYSASEPDKRVVLKCEFAHGGGRVVPIDGGNGDAEAYGLDM